MYNSKLNAGADGDEDKRVHDIVAATLQWSSLQPHGPRPGRIESTS